MASPEEDAATWLILTYRLPAKPASLRAAVRRKLTAADAVYLSSACAIAPLSRPAERAMRLIRATISGAGGSAVLMAARALSREMELTGACKHLWRQDIMVRQLTSRYRAVGLVLAVDRGP